MSTYSDVFTGATIQATGVALTELDLTADITLYWPREAEPNAPVLADTVAVVTSDQADRVITIDNATKVSDGLTILFDNRSAYDVIINKSDSTQLLSIASGLQFIVYLEDNTTSAGGWRTFQMGASAADADATVLAGYGIKAIGATLNQNITTSTFTLDFTLTTADRATYYNFTGSGSGIVATLPVASTTGSDWFCFLRNGGGADFTIDPQGSDTLNTESSLVMSPGDSAIIICDGANFTTVGLGQESVFAFDYVAIDVSGSSDYTISGSELNRISYKFYGAMTASFSVIVPATVQQYWINDSTSTSAYTLSVQTATQISPVGLSRGSQAIFYCDGTDVVPAVTATYSGSVDGGTF